MVAYTVKLKIDRGRTINLWNLASPLSNTLPVLKVFSYPFFLLPGFNANVFVTAFLALPIKPLIVPVYSLLSPSCKLQDYRAASLRSVWCFVVTLYHAYTDCLCACHAGYKALDQIPHPLEDFDDQIPSSPGRQRCQKPGLCPGWGGGGAC